MKLLLDGWHRLPSRRRPPGQRSWLEFQRLTADLNRSSDSAASDWRAVWSLSASVVFCSRRGISVASPQLRQKNGRRRRVLLILC